MAVWCVDIKNEITSTLVDLNENGIHIRDVAS